MCHVSALASYFILAIALMATPIGPAHAQGSCTEHPPPSTQGQGEVVNIDFNGPGHVDELLVRVKAGLLRPWVIDAFTLDITITSLNGNFHFHGTDVVPLADMTVFDIEGGFADLIVTWTEDQVGREVGDLYTACSQLLLSGTAISPLNCRAFGPF